MEKNLFCRNGIILKIVGYSCNSDGIGLSNSPANKLSIPSLNMSDRVSRVAEPICGNSVTFGKCTRGCSGGNGSGLMTSNPAPAIFPD